MYRCATCDAPVELVDGAPVRSCDHADAGIIAAIAAKTVGVGTADPPPETSADEAGQP